MEHEPVKYISGSAFNGNRIQGNRAISNLQDRNQTNLVSLTVWCSRNFITKRLGDTLISKKLLIGQRRLQAKIPYAPGDSLLVDHIE